MRRPYRYRIRMNGNGAFIVERKIGWFGFWWALQRENVHPLWGPNFEGYTALFDDVSEACNVLIHEQERDARERRAHEWTTVFKDAQ